MLSYQNTNMSDNRPQAPPIITPAMDDEGSGSAYDKTPLQGRRDHGDSSLHSHSAPQKSKNDELYMSAKMNQVHRKNDGLCCPAVRAFAA